MIPKQISPPGGSTFIVEPLEARFLMSVTVSIDGSVTHQTMDGFGSSERVFDDPHLFDNFNSATGRAATVLTTAQQDEVFDRLYVDLRLNRVRPASPDTAVGAGIEPTNDNADPNSTDLTKFNFNWKNLDAHVDYIARAKQRGVTTSFLSPLSRESWMGTTTSNDVAEYGEWLLAQVRRAAERGVQLPYLSVANEPSYSRNTMSGAFVRDVIKNLGPRLRAEGFTTMFVTPDDVRASDAAAKAAVVLADPLARKYVGALATHLYDESVTNVGQLETLAKQYGLPLWMTEFSLTGMGSAGLSGNAFAWASLMHQLISDYDVSAVDYMWGYFGEWEGNSSMLITLNNTGATYDGYTLNKTYYTTGQFSRFVDQGAQRIDATSTDSTVQTTAFLNGDGELVIVAVNNGSLNQQVSFSLNGLPTYTRVDDVRTSGTENWAVLSPITPSGSGFTATLPHGSVTTFTAKAATTVVGRRVFYNNSFWDGNDAAANVQDDQAIAPDKSLLLPGGGRATFANVSSYDKGINGLIFDIPGLPQGNGLGPSDFAADVSIDGVNWNSGPAPGVTVRRGISGADRVTLIWADGAIKNKWLRLTVKANTNTGLTAPDVSYFGNAVAETGNAPAGATTLSVDVPDYYGVRDHLRSYDNRAPITWNWDFNRDGVSDGMDLMLVRTNATTPTSALQLITAPPQTAAVQSPPASSVEKTGEDLTNANSTHTRATRRALIQGALRWRRRS